MVPADTGHASHDRNPPMNVRPLALAVPAIAALLLAGVGPQASAAPSPHANYHAQKVCDPAEVKAGDAACHALRLEDAAGNAVNPMVTSTGAMTPADIRAAYNLTSANSGGRTVAIVDAYGYPNAAADLAVYRSTYGLPACTVANGCLKIVNQTGGTKLPKYNYGWAGEQALDLDAVSATCPDCKILLVQANSASFADLGTAVKTAASFPGVVAISNSYGGGDAADATYGKYYNHPGIAVTASTGDNGYKGGSYPASSGYVTAVGGTSLKLAAGTARGWSETVWSGAGSGCSTLNAAPAGQAAFNTGCTGRAMADVSAVADPNTGLRIYAPTRSGSAWQQYGGTSLSAPIIAAVYALSGNTAGYANSLPYANPGAFNDVISGSNGTCPTSQWCTARAGWDGPTGLGTPNGVGGF